VINLGVKSITKRNEIEPARKDLKVIY